MDSLDLLMLLPPGADLPDLLARPPWMSQAACLERDTELFYPDRQGAKAAIVQAKALCAGCPVVTDRLQWALDHDELGVWGGTTQGERDAVRRDMAA